MRQSQAVQVPSSPQLHKTGVSLKGILHYLLPWRVAIHKAETPCSRQTRGTWTITIFPFLFLPTVVSERSWVGRQRRARMPAVGKKWLQLHTIQYPLLLLPFLYSSTLLLLYLLSGGMVAQGAFYIVCGSTSPSAPYLLSYSSYKPKWRFCPFVPWLLQ